MRKALIKTIAGLSAALFQLLASGSSPRAALVAHYPFDGSANDLSANANHGTVHGATLTTDRFGRPASAYLFDGSSSYIKMARPLPGFSSGSFSVWITAPSPGFIQVIFFEGDTTAFAAHFDSLAFNDGPTLQFPTKNHSSLGYAFGPKDTTRWFHIVGVADAARRRKELWIDGLLVATGSFTTSANVGSHSQLYVGSGAEGRFSFKGKIDDLQIFNRALTPTEIAALRLELRIQPTLLSVGGSFVPAISLSFQTDPGKNYTLQSTTDLLSWDILGSHPGSGTQTSISLPANTPHQLFRLRAE